MRNLFFVISFLFVMTITPRVSLGQPGGGDPNDGNKPGEGDPVPIGGLELLLIGGAALGAKKIISSRKKG
ncbi:MAG: hypothetical protein AAF149_00595 [Bacteroidota bacterium]